MLSSAGAAAARAGEPVAGGRLRVQLARVRLLEEDHAADDLVAPLENLQHRLQRRFQVEDTGERLADFEQRREAPDLVGPVLSPPTVVLAIRSYRM